MKSLNPTMVRFKCKLKNAEGNLEQIKKQVSIPLWFDSNVNDSHLLMNQFWKKKRLNPTMVRFKCKYIIGIKCGANSKVSIPLWFDSNVNA